MPLASAARVGRTFLRFALSTLRTFPTVVGVTALLVSCVLTTEVAAKTCSTDDDCFLTANPCNIGFCDVDVCSQHPAASGKSCFDTDGNGCTVALCNGAGSCIQQNPAPPGTGCTRTADPCNDSTCNPDGTCGNPEPAGTSCDNDVDPCTAAICNGVGGCDHQHAAPPGTACTRTADPCNDSTCNPAGTCGNPEPAGTSCDNDVDPCTAAICNGTGGCDHQHAAPPGTACTRTADPCNDSTCNPAGTCGNPEPAGTSCDNDVDPCTAAICNGVGGCDHQHAAPPGTACTRTADPCNDSTCNPAGTCGNPEPAGTRCDSECRFAACNGAGGCVQEHPAPPGTACSRLDDPCNDATCNPAGQCGNPEPAGTSCDSDADPCTAAVCDGTGGCDQQHPAPPGTSCSGISSPCIDNLCDGSGECGVPIACGDGQGGCTTDGCDPATGCLFPPGPAPDILVDPTSLHTPPCGEDHFLVVVGGPGPYTYQWQRLVNGAGVDLDDNAHFSGTHESSFTISPFRPGDEGSYRVLVSNGCGTTPSSDADVDIEAGGWGGGGYGPGRFGVALAYDSARARMVLYGGIEQVLFPELHFITYGDTLERATLGWSLVANTGPSPRSFAAMAYDAARGVTVLFGGASDQNSNVYNETWEWDGATWAQKADGPGARTRHAMVYDTERQRVQLYGGRYALTGQQLGDLWEWDGSAWVARNVIGDPSYNVGNGGWPGAREHPALAYDTVRHALVLHGGAFFSGPSHQFGETWELIDNHWHFKGVSGGALARGVEVAGYHAAHGKTILFTPTDTGFDIGVTWEWNGALPWKQTRVVSTEPIREHAANLVYDAAQKELVLYGGLGTGVNFSERNLVFFDEFDPTCGVPSVCGDGIVDADEACDDLGVGQCCLPSCQFEPPGTECGFGSGNCNAAGTCVNRCGDGVLESGEECDDGGDLLGCCDVNCLRKSELHSCTGLTGPGLCSAVGVCVAAICGNGVVEPGETCDDGATPGKTCCSATCGVVPLGPCGDVCRGDQCSPLGCVAGSDDAGGCTPATSDLDYLGASGGTLSTPDGSVTLVVPPGIGPVGTYAIAAGLAASEFGVGTSATRVLVARLEPAGTVFAPPGAQLTFRWPDADDDGRVDGLGLDERSLTIFHDGVAIGALCATDPGCNTTANTWTIAVTSFSEFVLVSEPCGTDIPAAMLKLAKLLPPGGDDTLAFAAKFPLAAGVPLDPIATGIRLVVQDDVGTTIADIPIPPGAYDKATKTGWKANKKLTAWSNAKKGGPKASLKRGKDDVLTIKVTGVGGTFSAPALPHVTVFLSESCGSLAFDGAGKSCALKSKGKTLACKAAPPRR